MKHNIQAVFIDRDGTMGGTGHFIHPRDFKLYPYTMEAINILKERNIKVIALTNQHRIARGEATVEDFQEEFSNLGIDGAYICPHSSKEGCQCHKPAPGMLIQAAEDHDLDLSKCVVIGDVGSSDMLAAHRVGALKVLVKTGWGKDSLGDFRHSWEEVEPDFIAEDLLDAVRWITNNELIFHEG
nr:HAD-IIIA family hydrolase [Paenibacillus bovis]